MKKQWRLDPRNEMLLDGDNAISLTSKAFKVLHYFVCNPGRILTKNEILEAIWGHSHVTEGLVREYVADLRRLLRDNARKPEIIETVHGRGYRLIGDILLDEIGKDAESLLADATDNESSRLSTEAPVVAVLPFEIRGCELQLKSIAEIICDDIIIDMSQYRDLIPIARIWCAHYAGERINVQKITRNLRATYIVMGNIQECDAGLRIRSHLINTNCGEEIWSNRSDIRVSPSMSLQDTIIEWVSLLVKYLYGEILRAERKRIMRKSTCTLNTYELYLLGYECESMFGKSNIERGIEYLEMAVKLDPNFARGWATLGSLCNDAVGGQHADRPDEVAARARYAVFRAMELDPYDPFALIECSATYAREGNLDKSRGCLLRARDLSANNSDVSILIAKYMAIVFGQTNDAADLADRAIKNNPYAPKWYYLHKQRISYFQKDFNAVLDASKYSVDDVESDLFEILALSQIRDRRAVASKTAIFIQRYPSFDCESLVASLPLKISEHVALFQDGISKAGLLSDRPIESG